MYYNLFSTARDPHVSLYFCENSLKAYCVVLHFMKTAVTDAQEYMVFLRLHCQEPLTGAPFKFFNRGANILFTGS